MAIRWEDLIRLSGDESYATYLQKARTRFEKGEAATTAELRKIYRRAAVFVRQDIEKVTPGTLRRAHLEALAKNLDDRAKSLNKEILAAAHKGIWLSVETGTEGTAKISEQLLKDAFDAADVRRLFAGINERAALAVLSRTGKDSLKLSDRVWRTSEKWRNAARRVIEDGVVRGTNPRKLAKEVEKYLQPGTWTALKAETRRRLGVAKDVSYEGMRLARTEMNNTFHESMIMANRAAPGYQGVYWRLSASHLIPDVCEDYASHNGNGYWPAGQEPVRPHPQCFCITFPAHEPPEQFAERLKNWAKNPDSDTKLEMWYNTSARQYLKRPGGLSMVTRSIPIAGRYPSSQQEIDDILKNELENIRFSAKVTYNSRLRAAGKTTATIYGGVSAKIKKIEVGKQAKPGRKELIETIIHEELEARIILRAYNLFRDNPRAKKMLRGGDKLTHPYINRIVKRYIGYLMAKGVIR